VDSFRTAQYQYIPALTSPREDKLVPTLNTAPSFYNPMSVLVVALPVLTGNRVRVILDERNAAKDFKGRLPDA